jgi:hypothetical protein
LSIQFIQGSGARYVPMVSAVLVAAQ